LLEIPDDTAVPLHCDFCVCMCSYQYITQQAAGNTTLKEIQKY